MRPRDSERRGAGVALRGCLMLLSVACGRAAPTTERGTWQAVQVSRQAAADPSLIRCIGGDTLPAWNAASEPHATADPNDGRRVLVAWQTHNGPRGAVLAAESSDGGSSWSSPQLLPFVGCGDARDSAFDFVSDPWTGFGADGRRYVGANVWNDRDSGAVAVMTWRREPARPEAHETPIHGNTKYAWIDGTFFQASPSAGGVGYVLTTRLIVPPSLRNAVARGDRVDWKTFSSPAVLSMTRDGGRSWTSPLPITAVTPGSYASGPQLLVHPSGVLVVFYGEGAHGAGVGVVVSRDEGRTWSPPRRVAGLAAWSGEIAHPRHPTRKATLGPDIVRGTVDRRTGAIHLVFVEGTDGAGFSSTRLWLTSSIDTGRTWSAPFRVGDTTAIHAVLPAVVADAGTVSVSHLSLGLPDSAMGVAWPAAVRLTTVDATDARRPRTLHEEVVDRFDFLPLRPDGGYFVGDYWELVRTVRNDVVPLYVKTQCTPSASQCRELSRPPGAIVSAEVFAGVRRVSHD